MNALAMIETCSQRQVRALLSSPTTALANGCIKVLPDDVRDDGRWIPLWRVANGSPPGCQVNLLMIKEECFMLTEAPQPRYRKVG